MLLDATILVDYLRSNALAVAFVNANAAATSIRIHSVVIGDICSA